MLHVTNGDVAGGLLEAARLPGSVLPWRDVLHEGPVPAGLPLDELSEVRARFVAEAGWDQAEAARRDFRERDRALARARDEDEVVLWFEADLYDQLQLIQILDWFAAEEQAEARMSLLVVDGALGALSSSDLPALFESRRPVGGAELGLGRRAWQAFRAPDPTELERVRDGDTHALPFLADALARHLEQFPSLAGGLARTERQILEAVAAGARTRHEIFAADQAREERRFIGDTVLWRYLDRLRAGPAPLVAWNGGASLTPTGEAVLAGRADWIELSGGIDRWLGGVHLEGAEAAWRWDPARGRLVPSRPRARGGGGSPA